MSRRPDEYTPMIAAKRLKEKRSVIYRELAKIRAGSPSKIPIEAVRITLGGQYFLKKSIIDEMRKELDERESLSRFSRFSNATADD